MELDKPNIEINWHRTKLSKDTLQSLNKRSDLKGAIQSLGFLGLILLTASSSFYFWWVENWWALAACIFLHGTITAFCINAVHELVHTTVFKTKWLNHLFAGLFSFIGIINHKMFWFSHTEHHKYTLHPPDDLEVSGATYRSTGQYFTSFIINFHCYREFGENIRYAFGKFIGPWEPVIVPEKAEERRRQVVNWSRFMLGGHLLITAVSLYYGLWIIPILVTFNVAYGSWLFYLCNFTQHSGLTENIDDFRLNCRTMYLNPVFRFLYWHMNWHIEHHMYAAVPCYNLKKLHYAIKHELPHTSSGLIEAWVEIAYIQYRRLADPDYRFVAELPNENGKYPSNHSRLRQIREQADARIAAASEKKPTGKRWECTICGFIYDEARGLPQEGIAPGTAWEDIPDDWQCPDCGVSKAEFDMLEISSSQPIDESALDIEAMAAKKNALVIVGSGLAGYGLAREVRKHDPARPIHLLTRDDGRAYSKPMLSNGLAQNKSADDLATATADEMAEKLNICVDTNCTVESIDRKGKRIITNQGEFPYGDLVLALGADPIRLPIQGDGADKIFSVNDLADYDHFHQLLNEPCRVVVLGAGLIGCEFANDLALAGHQVDLIDIAPTPLNRLIPEKIGRVMRERLESLGVTFHLGTSLTSVTADLNCELSNGKMIKANIVLSAVGLRARTDLAKAAGLSVSNGITVDEFLTTSDPNIYALGDCAEVHQRVLPFIAPMSIGIHALAKTLTGNPSKVEYPVMPVLVKTPTSPMIVAPPDKDADGQWQVEGSGDNLIARFKSDSGQILGFSLTGEACSKKQELLAELEQPAVALAHTS